MVSSAELPCIDMSTQNEAPLVLAQASKWVQSCDVDVHRGQILKGTQQRLKAQTHLSAQDAAAALAAASFLDQLTSSQVRLLGRCRQCVVLSTAHVPQFEHVLRALSKPKHTVISISTMQQCMLLRLLLQ